MSHEEATLRALDEAVSANRARLDAIEKSVRLQGEELGGVIRRYDDLAESLERVMRAHDGLVERVQNLGPCPELPAMELTAFEPGPVGMAMTIQATPDELVASVDRLNRIAEAAGSVVESMQFQTNFIDAHVAFIVYRLPSPEKET